MSTDDRAGKLLEAFKILFPGGLVVAGLTEVGRRAVTGRTVEPTLTVAGISVSVWLVGALGAFLLGFGVWLWATHVSGLDEGRLGTDPAYREELDRRFAQAAEVRSALADIDKAEKTLAGNPAGYSWADAARQQKTSAMKSLVTAVKEDTLRRRFGPALALMVVLALAQLVSLIALLVAVTGTTP